MNAMKRFLIAAASVLSASEAPSDSREGLIEVHIPFPGEPSNGEASSLSVALYGLGLMKHVPEATDNLDRRIFDRAA
jgi:hypothetical protein